MAGEGLSPNALMFNITHAAPPFTPALKPLLTLSTMFHTYTYLYLTIWIISQKDTKITISKTTTTPTGARDHSRTARVWVEATKLFTICSSDAPISWGEEYFFHFLCVHVHHVRMWGQHGRQKEVVSLIISSSLTTRRQLLQWLDHGKSFSPSAQCLLLSLVLQRYTTPFLQLEHQHFPLFRFSTSMHSYINSVPNVPMLDVYAT